MRKILSLIAMVAVVLGMAGCGQNDPNEPEYPFVGKSYTGTTYDNTEKKEQFVRLIFYSNNDATLQKGNSSDDIDFNFDKLLTWNINDKGVVEVYFKANVFSNQPDPQLAFTFTYGADGKTIRVKAVETGEEFSMALEKVVETPVAISGKMYSANGEDPETKTPRVAEVYFYKDYQFRLVLKEGDNTLYDQTSFLWEYTDGAIKVVYKDGAVDVETGKDASGQTFMTGTYDAAKDQVTLVMATQKEEKIVYSFEQNI